MGAMSGDPRSPWWARCRCSHKLVWHWAFVQMWDVWIGLKRWFENLKRFGTWQYKIFDRWWFQIFFGMFIPNYLGIWSNLTVRIFFKWVGKNHQLVLCIIIDQWLVGGEWFWLTILGRCLRQGLSLGSVNHQQTTVDGWNHAPPGMYETL